MTTDAHPQKARADAQANNSAKVEAVRSTVLDDAQRYAGKYLDILDKDIDAWKKLLESGTFITICLALRRWIRMPPPSRVALSEPS